MREEDRRKIKGREEDRREGGKGWRMEGWEGK